MMTDPPPHAAMRESRSAGFLSGMRQVCDLFLSLLIAVLLMRTFLLQGYLISTGSMAPHYYGQQKRAVCPECEFTFAVGTEFDLDSHHEAGDWAICPNCYAAEIDLSERPVNRGDHLLVWKNACSFRDPKRWEVIVFRNPNDPLETYIKRVAGLPGESLAIRDGNVWIDGEIARKSLAEQRALRVPLFDQSFLPSSDDTWEPRWTTDSPDSGWSPNGTTWRYEPSLGEEDWLTYRQTVRFGGHQETTVCLSTEIAATIAPAFAPPESTFPFTPEPRFPGVRWDRGCLIATGALSPSTMEKLTDLSSSPSYRDALQTLFQESRQVTVSDFLAYNHEVPDHQPAVVHDFFLEASIQPDQQTGTVMIELGSSAGPCQCHLDLTAATATLHSGKELENRHQAQLKMPLNQFVVEMSSFDDQILVAINGREIFRESLSRTAMKENSVERLSVARISGTTPFEIGSLRLFRDIHYTGGSGMHGSEIPYQIPDGHYFVLGDNSRVSSDSRLWEQPTVPRKLLIGKPFLVHLPSTQKRIGWGKWQWTYRCPDFSRIRFVR
ncbi:MAG: signal peptidase I [Planctomycetaceae bacterium]|nr:signal peptidase I [Planctomycetaceae bacterium]